MAGNKSCHAEINRTDDVSGKYKQISRMGIGMEKTKIKHLFHDKLGPVPGDLSDVQTLADKGRLFGNLHPPDKLHGQHTLA